MSVELPQSMAEARDRGWDPSLTNEDIMPNPTHKRTWNWFNYAALWMGMIHNMVAFSIVGGLIAAGYSGVQALTVVGIGSLIQLAFLAITGRVGSRYGIPFAVWGRTALGSRGTNVPALLRAGTAIALVGVQVYLAGSVINVGMGAAFGWWANLDQYVFQGVAVNLWIAMLGFWLLHFVVIRHGMNTIRRFENWAGPMVIVVLVPLTVWSIVKAGGLGPVFEARSRYASFWEFLTLGFVSAVALFIAGSWSTLILNYPDLTRFARSNRQQVLGTFIGFPLASIVFYGMVAIIVSTLQATTGTQSWEPADVLLAVSNTPLIIVGAALLTVATLSVNIAANLVSPSYDLANALPRWLTFRRAGALALVLAVIWAPWKVMQDPDSFFSLFGYFAVALGPATGLLITDYLIVRKRRIDVDELYRRNGRYGAYRGFNLPGLAVLTVSTLICLAGAVFDSVDFLYTYGWFVGVGSSSVLYLTVVYALRTWWPRPLPEFEPAGTEGNEAEEGAEAPSRPVEPLPARL